MEMKFINNKGLYLVKDENVLFDTMRLWIKGQGGEKQYLDAESVSESEVRFSNKERDITAALNLTVKGQVASLNITASYDPALGDIFGQNHLDIESAIGIDIAAMPDTDSYMANFMRCSYWCGTEIFDKLSDMPERTQALLTKSKVGNYVYLLTTCDEYFKSNLKANENGGFTLFLYSHFPQSKCDTCSLIIGFDPDPYKLPSMTADYGLELMGKSGGLRETRRYPEIFEYLGWCSWDAFHMEVTHDGLVSKAKEFKDKDIPVRWMLIDDMWAECHNNNRKTMHSREMYNFEADPERFPKGLKGAVEDLKDNYGMKVGIWYPTTGYWGGIDPEGPIAKEHGDKLTVGLNGRLIPSPDFNKLFGYFHSFNSFFRSCKADFVKVDYQSCIFDNYSRLVPIGMMAKNLHDAIEASVGACFDGNLINCMGMANENFWNRPKSIINRISGDFQPEDRKWFIQHLIQCSFNAFAQGSLYTGDWDMWWSDDAQSSKNAVLRAMSGGPVYVSDELGRSIKEKIKPIVYSNGRIIRLKESARPVESCLLENCETNGKIYKVFNRTENGGILAAFNIDTEENPVSGRVSAGDIYGMSDCRCAVIDYFARSAVILEKGKDIELTLKDYDDFRLYYIIPLTDRAVPVGIIDKYMAPATFKTIAENKCIVTEGGCFCFVGDTAPENVTADGTELKVEKIGEKTYTVNILQDKDNILLEWE